MQMHPTIRLLEHPAWKDYELVDSGHGRKLERFGPYHLVRPEAQAIWRPGLSEARWRAADATFEATGEESGGHWNPAKNMAERWQMQAPAAVTGRERPVKGDARDPIRFWAMTTPGRHLGVFVEAAAHWQWLADLITAARRPMRVLNLFGYTGLASLEAARAGAAVTHVDASKRAISWAKENQSLSRLDDRPIRWIVDDALKFVRREARRAVEYDGIILDPPKFGRGPKGEVWEVYKSLPALLEACRDVLSPKPLFVILTVYAVRASAVHLHYALQDMMTGRPGHLECGELVTRERSVGRLLSQAVYARWNEEL